MILDCPDCGSQPTFETTKLKSQFHDEETKISCCARSNCSKSGREGHAKIRAIDLWNRAIIRRRELEALAAARDVVRFCEPEWRDDVDRGDADTKLADAVKLLDASIARAAEVDP